MGQTPSDDMINVVRERGGDGKNKLLIRIFVEQREITAPLLDSIKDEQLQYILETIEIEESALRDDPEETQTAIGMLDNQRSEVLYDKICEWLNITIKEE